MRSVVCEWSGVPDRCRAKLRNRTQGKNDLMKILELVSYFTIFDTHTAIGSLIIRRIRWSLSTYMHAIFSFTKTPGISGGNHYILLSDEMIPFMDWGAEVLSYVIM